SFRKPEGAGEDEAGCVGAVEQAASNARSGAASHAGRVLIGPPVRTRHGGVGKMTRSRRRDLFAGFGLQCLEFLGAADTETVFVRLQAFQQATFAWTDAFAQAFDVSLAVLEFLQAGGLGPDRRQDGRQRQQTCGGQGKRKRGSISCMHLRLPRFWWFYGWLQRALAEVPTARPPPHATR